MRSPGLKQMAVEISARAEEENEGIYLQAEREKRGMWQSCQAEWWENESVIVPHDNIVKQQSGNWIQRRRAGEQNQNNGNEGMWKKKDGNKNRHLDEVKRKRNDTLSDEVDVRCQIWRLCQNF